MIMELTRWDLLYLRDLIHSLHAGQEDLYGPLIPEYDYLCNLERKLDNDSFNS